MLQIYIARLAIEAGQMEESIVWDTAGPKIYSFDEMLEQIKVAVGSHSRLVHVHPKIALMLSGIVGRFLKDVVLTQDEIDGLLPGLLVTSNSPLGQKSLGKWLMENRDSVGKRYSLELARHYQ